MTFEQIKAAVKSQLNLTSNEADTRVGEAINRHYKRVTSLIGMDTTRFVTRSVTTTNGVSTVTFDNIEKIDHVYDTTSTIRELDETERAHIRTTTNTGQPSQWAPYGMTSTSVTILIDTTPQTSYSLQADGWATIADLEQTDEPVFAESFHDILTFSVLAEELLRKEKDRLAAAYDSKAEKLLGELRFHLADSPTKDTRQGTTLGSSSAGGSSNSAALGATAYTQTALVTFDLGSGIAPFAVAESNAPTVTNLDADKLDGLDSTDFATALHGSQHQFGGLDEISVAGLSGLLADKQTPLPAGSDTQVQFNDAGAQGGDSGLTYSKTTDTLTTGDLVLSNGGAWTAVTFNAANFTGNAAMTWTVASGDQTTLAYRKLGKTMTVAFVLVTTTVAGTPDTTLQIAIPDGFTANREVDTTFFYSDNGTSGIGRCFVSAGGVLIQLRTLTAAVWSAAADTTAVRGEITFETTA